MLHVLTVTGETVFLVTEILEAYYIFIGHRDKQDEITQSFSVHAINKDEKTLYNY